MNRPFELPFLPTVAAVLLLSIAGVAVISQVEKLSELKNPATLVDGTYRFDGQ